MKTMSMINLISEVRAITDEQFNCGQLNATLMRKVHELCNTAEKSLEMPVPQFTTVYYIVDSRVYTGWYLAKVGENSHLILQDRIEMGICWTTDGYWFTDEEEANTALLKMQAASTESEKH